MKNGIKGKRSTTVVILGLLTCAIAGAEAPDSAESFAVHPGPPVEEASTSAKAWAPEITEPPAALKANFDGNGYADLAIGAPREDVDGALYAGAVSAFYWNTSSMSPASGVYWEQDDLEGSDSEGGDLLGEALAVGDFNGDGVYDLAVGVPFEDWSYTGGLYEDAGIVHVIYGASGTGLTLSGDQFWHQDSVDVNGTMESFDNFGHSLATGDFNGDGYDDLAIGVPAEDSGVVIDSGAVNVLYGSASGIQASDDQMFTQTTFGLEDGEDENFGSSLASGDFNGDGYDDLAIGTPGESVLFEPGAGAVFVALGSASRLTVPASGFWWHQNISGVHGVAEVDDRFGYALAAGDFDDDGYDDLAISVPMEDLGNPVVDHAGAVHVLYGSSSGPTSAGADFFYQGYGATSNDIEPGDQFGRSLTVGDFDGDGYDDLVISAPWENWSVIVDTGMIHVFSGSSAGLEDDDQFIHQDLLSSNGNNEEDDHFGFALAAADFNGDGYDDIVVGSPFEDIDNLTDAGWVTMLYGTPGGISLDNSTITQESASTGGTSEINDNFGWAVAAAPFQSGDTGLIFADGFESGDIGAW
jgi:hypothetical protein